MQVLSAKTNNITHIIHIADIHIRVGNYETARVAEYKQVFDRFLDEITVMDAVVNETALLVICGDIFHSKCRMESAGTQIFFDWINKLLDLVPIIIICGNHDYKQSEPDVTDSVEMLCTPYQKGYGRHKFGIHYLSQTGQYIWNNIGFGIVSVKDTLRAFNTAGIVSDLPDFPNPALLDTCDSQIDFKVALFHGTISQSALPSGKSADSVSHGYPLMWFAGYDALMLGDNHKQQLHTHINEDVTNKHIMKWGYSGSLVQQDFGETVHGHGYILWDVSAKSGTMHHINNDYGALTVIDESIYISPQVKYNFKDAVALSYFPKSPRVRIIGDRDDIAICETLFKRYNIVPSEIIVRSKLALTNRKVKNVSETEGETEGVTECETEHVNDYEITNKNDDLEEHIRKLTNLNSPECWETYIKTTYVDSTQVTISTTWLHEPKQMMVPFSYNIHESLRDSIKLRNTKLEKLYDVYEKHVTGVATNNYNISFKHMQWDYLMCYGEGNYFDFAKIDDKIALINGANATGKSAFLDVLCIAIYGEPTTSRRDFSGSVMSCKIINDHKPHGTVSGVVLHVEIAESSNTSASVYEIQRTFINHSTDEQSDSVKPSIIAVYKIDENTQTKTVVAEGASTVNIWIAKYFGSIDEILMSSILCQNDNINFFTHKPAEQKLIIEKALHMDTISSFVEYLEECVKSHKYILEKVHSYRQGLMQSNDTCNGTTNGTNNATCSITEQSLSEMELQLDSYKKDLENLLNHNNELLGIIGNIGMTTQASIENIDSDDEIAHTITELENKLPTITNVSETNNLRESFIRLNIQRDLLIEKLKELHIDYGVIIENTMSDTHITKTLEEYNIKLVNIEAATQTHISSHNAMYNLAYIEEKENMYYEWLNINSEFTSINTNGAIVDYNMKNKELNALLEVYKKYEGLLTTPLQLNNSNIINKDIYNTTNIAKLYNDYNDLVKQVSILDSNKPVYNETIPVENIENVIKSYNTWISQFPTEWLATTNSAISLLREKLTQMRTTYDKLMNDEYIRKPTINTGANSGANTGANTTKQYTITQLEKLQEPIHVDKDISKYDVWQLKWTKWCEYIKSLPSESVDEINDRIDNVTSWITKIKTVQDTLTKLEKEYTDTNDEITAINKMEFNPECWACCKQPKMIRLQDLKILLASIEKRIVKYKQYLNKHGLSIAGFENELTELREKIEIRKNYEEKHEIYVAENNIWLNALNASEREAKRKVKLEIVWWNMWTSWNNKVSGLKESIAKLQLYLDSYIAQNESYEIAVANKTVADLFIKWSQTYDSLQIKLNDSHLLIWLLIKDSIRNITETIADNNATIVQLKLYNTESAKWNDILDILKVDKLYHITLNKYNSDIQLIKDNISNNLLLQSLININLELNGLQNNINILNDNEMIKDDITILKSILALRKWEVNNLLIKELNSNITGLTKKFITDSDTYNRFNAYELNSRAINNAYNDIKTRYERLTEFHTRFVGTKTIDGFKNWVYKNMVIPLIEREMNAFIINIDIFSVNIRMKSGKLIFMLNDRGSKPTLDHASGYQKYIAGLAMRIALLRIGAVGKNIKHLILDEGFVACDSINILKTKEIMELLMKIGDYKSIMMISHLENIRDIADTRIDVSRCAKNLTSYIRFGAVRKQIRKAGIMEEGVTETPKKKGGRPRKNTANN